MVHFCPTISNHVRFLLRNVDDANFDSVLGELSQFIEYGKEGSVSLLQTFLDEVDFHGGNIQNIELKQKLFAEIFRCIMARPNFTHVFCKALKSMPGDDFIGDLTKALDLSISEEIALGLALSDSENQDFRIRGQNFCMSKIEGLSTDPKSKVSITQIQDIITFLSHSDRLSRHLDSFMKMLSLLEHKEIAPLLVPSLFMGDLLEVDSSSSQYLDPFFGCGEDDFEAILSEMEKDKGITDIMMELGYGITVNASHCKEMLSRFLPLDEVTISRILGAIARTRTGLDDGQNTYSTFCSALGSNSAADSSWLCSWNVDVLVDSIKQLAPETNWTRVMENLDQEGFYFPDGESFHLFMSIYKNACQDPFPLHAVCGSIWSNVEGQLSFLKYAVSAPPEIFTFQHSSRQMSYVDGVHGIKLLHQNTNQAWFCLDLLQLLCQLAEMGYASTVRLMLENPLKQYPDALLLGMAHINTKFNLIQYEVSSTIFPSIIGNSTKGAIISQIWHINPKLVLRGFVDIHNADSETILRILDVCQELQILSSVLEMTPFKFSIKLAAYGSMKECINLEKWLNENMNTYKDAFFEECVNFLKGMPFDASNVSTNPFQHSGAIINIHPEISCIFLKVLEAHSAQLTSHNLAEEMKRLQAASLNLSQRLQSGDANDSSDAIEAEANAYFHQMFSGQITIETMVQMLARFKDSPEKREQSIFDCMIGNLFEEYKFFPKYPERQLKITAILFGSLIKHQLVSHLPLGIALRGVLDALRKSVDSKMFAFGAKALEQFVDRLVEWPQYCNHILQISHLRATHAELVSFIERTLASISSESNGGNIAQIDHQQGSSMSSMGNEEGSEASWQLGNAGSSSSQQLSSLQVQQKHQGLIDDKQNVSASLGFMKPLVSSSGQPSLVTAADTIATQKITSLQVMPPLSSASGSATMASSQGFLRPARAITPAGMLRPISTGFGSALNIETLVAAAERRDTPIEAPTSEIQDKILFMINNISLSNMEMKAKEFNEVLREQYYPWFAQYMVMKRASIEPNFHDLYLKFLDKVNSRPLNKEIGKATYENCKVLLRSELIKSSSEERSLLKNLGSWLGKFTIGRNQVLRARDIDPKVLIVEAYEKGLMIAVIPFTSKILEPCQSSLAYRPPNPWTMGILSLLAEIYALPNLKMNLKFDIEVLFKNLGVTMKDVKPTSLLKDRLREVEGNPDFSNKDNSASQSQTPAYADANSGMLSTLNQVEMQSDIGNPSVPSGHPNYASSLNLSSGPLGEDAKLGNLTLPERLPTVQGPSQFTPPPSPFSVSQLPTPISNIGSQVVVNQKLGAGLQMQFQRIVPTAMERAIRDIMPAVVQRSVTIASRTTKELVLKDYAVETDDKRILTAAHLMVTSLAGSLAHVTCKEPLRLALSNQLRSFLLSSNVGSELLEHAVQLVANDNLDLACAVIEHAASERALHSIDREMSPSLDFKRKQREGVGSAFYEASSFAKSSFASMPESLRPKSGRLSNSQLRVYEDFARFPWKNQSTQGSSGTSGLPVASDVSTAAGLSRIYSSGSGLPNSSIYSTAQMISGFSNLPQQMDLIPEEMDATSAQFLSAATNHVGATDNVVQHGSEVSSGTPLLSAGTSLDVHVVENNPAMKESGSIIQPLSGTSATERLGTSISDPSLTTGDALDKYQQVSEKLESLISKDAKEAEIQGVIAEVPEIILKCTSRDEAALAIAQKVFKSLFDNASNSIHIASHIGMLAAIRDVCKIVVKELTSWVIYSDEERKLNKDISIGLIQSELLNLAEYNFHLAKLIDGGRNKAVTDFATSLIQTLMAQDSAVVSELPNVVDVLAKIAVRSGSPESLQQLIEIARNPSTNVVSIPGAGISKEDKARQSRDKKVTSSLSMVGRDDSDISESTADHVGFRDQVSLLFSEWCRICEHSGTIDTASTHYVSQLQQNGLLKGDDITDRFFRIPLEISVAHCVASELISTASLPQPQQVHNMSFIAMDMYAKLVVAVLKYCGVDQGSNKIILLPKILAVAVRVIQKDAEEKKSSFNPRPYFRLFLDWILDLGSPDPVFDGANFQILTSFANAFHALQPLKVPSWSFAWLELVSHRSFMPKLLISSAQKGWPFIQRLLVDLFKFMEPYLRNAELGEPVHFLYKGTLRVLLVLLHDFPEFLCDYHFSFCDVIPPSCIQMRNVILSAFPRNMRLPDPSTPNLKIDLLAEINQSPRILSEVDLSLKAKLMKAEVDEYLKTRQQGSPFLAELKQKLLLNQNEIQLAGTRYNVPLINSLVLYVGMQAIQYLQNRPAATSHAPGSSSVDVQSIGAVMDIFQMLIEDLDTEGRYLFINAAANQLRYPNSHTHYFSFILLYLFVEAKQEIIQEQITRVLLERLIVNRPHPWGLLITFIELIKNLRYSFWSRSFTRCSPEMERLFESVARSCGAQKAADDSMVASGIPDSNH